MRVQTYWLAKEPKYLPLDSGSQGEICSGHIHLQTLPHPNPLAI